MHNKGLAKDYITRSEIRLLAVEVLYQKQSWADVVRESQEIVELSLKSLLRQFNIEIPRIHDVSTILSEEKDRFPAIIQKNLENLIEISRMMRRDRELSFYGSEDLTPMEFYKKKDADRAFKDARFVVETVKPHIA